MADEKSSLASRDSRYVSGGQTEASSWALEWWERSVIPTEPDDRQYVVTRRVEGRLDLIAHEELGDPRLWWVVAMLNNLLDVHAEVREGAVLYIPTPARAQAIRSGRPGGEPSTREPPRSLGPAV